MRFRPTLTRPGLTFAYCDAKTGAASWAGTSIGAAAADRILAILVMDAAGTPPSGCTVDGVSATLRHTAANNHCRLFTHPLAAGTTATIAVTGSSSATLNSIVVFALYGIVSAVPATLGDAASPGTISISCAGGGLLIAGGINSASVSPALTGGLTSDAVISTGALFTQGAHVSPTGTSYTIGGTSSNMIAAVWNKFQ